ncbi:haloacid dehalogenase-like hydrolase [Nocardia asiatica]|uniref:haloacid dehalogenase-like hydrolase n=1 Tax=Nocardia asiatica TaxID=209252 RepID=UPI0005C19D62|nr:haloacid dehalogenase-like hydrolase [Nocardia asiatica]
MSAALPPTETSPRVLVLWDIDHTLIESRGFGRTIYRRAFRAATGNELENYSIIAGRTEFAISAEMLRINGIEPHGEAIRGLVAALEREFELAKAEFATLGRALPGAEATLRLLAADPRIHQSVLTGNVRSLARIKLEAFRLDRHLDLDVGAYGDDHENRANLVSVALRRARASGVSFEPGDTVLIGDTPHDVKAATESGAMAIGVATGASTLDELRAAGADIVIPDLSDSQQVKNLIFSLLPGPTAMMN